MRWRARVVAVALLVCLAVAASAQEKRIAAKETLFAPGDIAKRALHRRAVEAAVWGMPIVSVDAMREAFFRDVVTKYGDIGYFSKPADWKFQTTTPNASSLYVYFNFNTKDGPIVLDFPAAVGAGLFGTLLDAWQIPLVDVGPKGEDQGKGGNTCCCLPASRVKCPLDTFRFDQPPITGTLFFAPYRPLRLTRIWPKPSRW